MYVVVGSSDSVLAGFFFWSCLFRLYELYFKNRLTYCCCKYIYIYICIHSALITYDKIVSLFRHKRLVYTIQTGCEV